MKKLFVLLFCLSLLACSKQIRYTPEEIRGFPPDIQEKIVKEQVSNGMTYQQVRYSWGPPSEVIKMPSSKDGKELQHWTYSSRLGLCKISLIFVDGKVTGSFMKSPKAEDSSAIKHTDAEIRSFPADIQERIRNNEVVTGMTKLQVRYSWGAPDEVNMTVDTAGKQVEEWSYGDSLICKSRLIFKDDKVSAIALGDRPRDKK